MRNVQLLPSLSRFFAFFSSMFMYFPLAFRLTRLIIFAPPFRVLRVTPPAANPMLIPVVIAC